MAVSIDRAKQAGTQGVLSTAIPLEQLISAIVDCFEAPYVDSIREHVIELLVADAALLAMHPAHRYVTVLNAGVQATCP